MEQSAVKLQMFSGCSESDNYYVVKTRFTESPAVVESKRGGGIKIRIGRIEFSIIMVALWFAT